jgi:DNA topoisomerase IA
MSEVERICDMRDGFKLQVFKSPEDGDIHVSVMKETDKVNFDSVEFCNSGSQSPRTYRALCELIKAMEKDAEEYPQQSSASS